MPHPTDIFVGLKVKEARNLRGLSQEALAAKINVSFQQVQKYEKGTNRIGSSRLFMIAEALDVPVGSFFEGLRDTDTPKPISTTAMRLAQKIEALPEGDLRYRLNGLVAAMITTYQQAA